MSLVVIIIISFILLNVILTFNFIISKKAYKSIDKIAPFECGFDAFASYRVPFSLHFYLITAIFLLFDIEISLVLPIIGPISISYIEFYHNIILIFFILLVGLLIE